MKTFILILSLFGASLIVLGLTHNNVKAQGPKAFLEDHHSCRGTSGIGGSCSATCTDKQNCTCNTGFFACNCFCDSPVAGSQISAEPGPIENWENVKNSLLKENNVSANEIASKLLNVYSLAGKDAREYQKQATALDVKFYALPADIQARAVNSIAPR